ncbi:hypothetical protein WH47_01273 [Habropoda laboriosa]|uniref:Uncharacterized protein n=1 Tax=Habropoda laboriosa TaxID=597456 RepID=A0A0L7QZD3_9HYME|nr:hypothetical protein WH47_01273 [Habropoda laboriosa]
MVGISIVDEFSKYAKLQRKYNKLESVLKEKVLMLILSYLYNNKPVIILPKGILWPIQSLLSWPCYHEDSISLIMWLIIAKLVVSMCKKINKRNINCLKS